MRRKIFVNNKRGEKFEVKGIIETTDTYESYLCVGAENDNKGQKWILHKLKEQGSRQAWEVPKIEKAETIIEPSKSASTGTSKHIAGWNSTQDVNIDNRIKAGIKESGRVK